MTVLFVVLPLAVLFSALALAAFIWSTRSGQLDDLETPAMRVLCDDAALRLRESDDGRTRRSGAR
jgi:cbb3-type cytochrome oxidase maturation protein